jgi:uncharacterized lipoprotein YajG
MVPAILLLAGCAVTSPQVINLDLHPRAASTAKGKGVPVIVRVRDKRSDNVIGYQTHENGKKSNPIVPVGNVEKKIYQSLAKGLGQEGFEPHKYTGPSKQKPRLTVTLKKLSYNRENGEILVAAEVGVKAETGEKIYTASYSASRKTSQGASKEINAKMINGALTATLQNLLNDRKLIVGMAGQERH